MNQVLSSCSAVIFLAASLNVSCGKGAQDKSTSDLAKPTGEMRGNDLSSEEEKRIVLDDRMAEAMQGLRTYCKSCHAIGGLRFIFSDEDAVLANDLRGKASPRSKKLWKDIIAETLSWPGVKMPPFDQFMTPPDRDWMPKGAKRQALADARAADGTSLRGLMLEVLNGLDSL